MEGNSDLSIRRKVDDAYERIVTAIFASLTHLAKMDKGEGQAAEDKGQLNYHVIMIGELCVSHISSKQTSADAMTENMYHFVEDLRKIEVPTLGLFFERAKGLYEENMGSYTKLMIRKSFGRLMVCHDTVIKTALGQAD